MELRVSYIIPSSSWYHIPNELIWKQLTQELTEQILKIEHTDSTGITINAYRFKREIMNNEYTLSAEIIPVEYNRVIIQKLELPDFAAKSGKNIFKRIGIAIKYIFTGRS